MSPERWFVDTNLLVYITHHKSPFRMPSLARLREALEEGVVLAVSTQVLREYLAAVGRPGELGLETALENVRIFRRSLVVLEDSLEVSERLAKLLEEHPVFGYRVHDANIVATMLTAGIEKLLTNNPKHFQDFSNIIEVVPLQGPSDQ